MRNQSRTPQPVWEIIKCAICVILATALSCAVCMRAVSMENGTFSGVLDRLGKIEQSLENDSSDQEEVTDNTANPLQGKHIIYEGDSIAESRDNNGGGYAFIIAEYTGSTYSNFAQGGARLCSTKEKHSVVDNLSNLPKNGDLYCFEGGINDFWANTPIGTCDPQKYDNTLNTKTICGAMETIFRYCMENFPGKPVCFVITHKVQETAYKANANGDTFEDYRDAMVEVCQKYSIPYYDAFMESGLNGWNETQSEKFLAGNSTATGDGTHPNAEGYKHYYVPQLIDLFQRIMPVT